MDQDLTKQSDVVNLMQSSRSEAEWNENTNKVKSANGGVYPSFWYSAIMLSGLAQRVAQSWTPKRDAKIHITVEH